MFKNIGLALIAIAGFAFFSGCKKGYQQPAPDFTYSGNSNQITFTVKDPNSRGDYQWDFGDGSTTSGISVVHTYKIFKEGSFTIKCTNTGDGANTSTNQTVVFEKLIEIDTRFGNMVMWLYKQADQYRQNFFKLTDSGFYDSTTFHRVKPDWVIQGGDPYSKNGGGQLGTGGPGYDIPFFSDTPLLSHVYGAVGAASYGPGTAGNGSQFYIVVNKTGDHSLDGKYPVFGFILDGMDVAYTISKQPNDGSGNNYAIATIRMGVKTIFKTQGEIKDKYKFTLF